MATFSLHDSPSPHSHSDPSNSDPDQHHPRTVDVAFSPYGSSSSDQSSPYNHDALSPGTPSATPANNLFLDGSAAFSSLMSSFGTGGDGVWPGAYAIGASGIYGALSPQSSARDREGAVPASAWDASTPATQHDPSYRTSAQMDTLVPSMEPELAFNCLVVEEECGPSTVPSPRPSTSYPEQVPGSNAFGVQLQNASSATATTPHGTAVRAILGVDGHFNAESAFLHPSASKVDAASFNPAWLSTASQNATPILIQPKGASPTFAVPAKNNATPSHTSLPAPRPTPSSATITPANRNRDDDGSGVTLPHQSTAVELAVPGLVHPPRAGDHDDLELLLLGVVSEGAKSRVETQVKITMVLAKRQAGVTKRSGQESSSDFIDEHGRLAKNVGSNIERVGSWSHVKLPSFSAIKRRSKKLIRTGIPDEETLFLDVAVIRATEPREEIFCCINCQARESKRLQRKKAARVRPPQEVGSDDDDVDDGDNRRKIVLFNCGQYLNFETGEVTLPTRVTCYCRHHKEKKGFCIIITLRDVENRIVASGTTPPILITDDHKAAAAAAKASRPSSDAEKHSPANASHKALPVKKSEAVSFGKMPQRRRGAEHQSDGDRPRRMAPYHSSQRNPQRRGSGHVSRSPSFAMTPLLTPVTMSKPGSPVHQTKFSRTAPVSLAPSPDSTGNINLPAIAPQTTNPTPEVGADAFEALARALIASNALPPTAVDTRSSRAIGSAPALDTVMRDESGSSQSSQGSPAMRRAIGLMASPPQSPDASVESFSSIAQSSSTSMDVHHCPPSSSIGLSVPSAYNPVLANPLVENQGMANALNMPVAGTSQAWGVQAPTTPGNPIPRIGRLIPGEGPMQGGIEVTILGEGFFPGIVCVFGDTPAMPTYMWSSNTLVCTLPPSASPGPCVVSFRGIPITVGSGSSVQVFTYIDNSDQKLMELALQVVGLQMTGRIQDAKNVAMRIVGESGGGGNNSAMTSTGLSQKRGDYTAPHPPVDASNLNILAASLANAATSIMDSPAQTRPPSRRDSTQNLGEHTRDIETRSFESIIIRFLTLLDFQSPGTSAEDQQPQASSSPISLQNAQGHTLLHLAVLLGFHKLVAYLLRHGVAVNVGDKNGFTALHFAALNGRVAITRLLLDAGAATYLRNCTARTALDLARDRDQIDIVEFFGRYRSRSTYSSRQPSRSFSEVSTPASSIRSSRSNSPYHGRHNSNDESDDDVDDGESSGEADSTDERGSVDSLRIGKATSRVSRSSSIGSLNQHQPALPSSANKDVDAKSGGGSDEEEDQTEITQSVITRRRRQEGLEPTVVRFQIPGTRLFEKFAFSDKLRIPTPPSITAWTDLPTYTMNGLAVLNPMAWTATAPTPQKHEDVPKEQKSSVDEKSETGKSESNSDWKRAYVQWWPPSNWSTTNTPTIPPLVKGHRGGVSRYSHGIHGDVGDNDDVGLTSSPELVTPDRFECSLDSQTASNSSSGSKVQSQPRLVARRRKPGYMPSIVDEHVMDAFTYHDLKSFKTDRMLYFFWIPVLCLALFYSFYEVVVYLKPYMPDFVPNLVRERSWIRL